jgi:pimeloyl-ACP methyl ester carboxylesterase
MSEDQPFIVLVAGYSNYTKKYPAYEERFGSDNFAHTTNAKRYTVDEHLDELKSLIPQNRPYMLVGYSMGASLIIELLNREKLENCKGVTLIGGSRYQPSHWFLTFTFMLPIPFIYFFATILLMTYPFVLLFSGFNFEKARLACYEGSMKSLRTNKAREMKKEYNQCIRKVGRNVHGILEENEDIPALFIRLKEDLMVDEEDLQFTKTFFNKTEEIVLAEDIIHLTHAMDAEFIDIIISQKKFFGY